MYGDAPPSCADVHMYDHADGVCMDEDDPPSYAVLDVCTCRRHMTGCIRNGMQCSAAQAHLWTSAALLSPSAI